MCKDPETPRSIDSSSHMPNSDFYTHADLSSAKAFRLSLGFPPLKPFTYWKVLNALGGRFA